MVTVLSPNSGPSPAHGQPEATAVQVSAAAKCSQQLQCLSTAFGRDQGSPEQLQTHSVWVNRGIIPLCLTHGEHFSALHISLNPKSQQRKQIRCVVQRERSWYPNTASSSSSMESPWQPVAAPGGIWPPIYPMSHLLEDAWQERSVLQY